MDAENDDPSDDDARDDHADGPNGAGPGRTGSSKLSKEDKAAQIAQEREDLLAQLANGNFEELRPRVASLLNHLPQTRNSDVDLWIAYWQTFDAPALIGAESISFHQLRRVTRPGTLTRTRAKIQNEYKLFLADKDVRRRRADLAVDRREEAIDERPERPLINIFLDESKATKNDHYYVVGSLWIHNQFELMKAVQALTQVRQEAGFSRELHFTELGKNDVAAAKLFIERAATMTAHLGFKAVAIKRQDAGLRPTDEVVFKLHERLLIDGIAHELASGRFGLPRDFVVLKDQDDGADKLRLGELTERLAERIPGKFGDSARFRSIDVESSAASLPLQLVDLFTGAVMRRLNRQPEAALNHKDDLSDFIWQKLRISLDDGSDFSRVFIID